MTTSCTYIFYVDITITAGKHCNVRSVEKTDLLTDQSFKKQKMLRSRLGV